MLIFNYPDPIPLGDKFSVPFSLTNPVPPGSPIGTVGTPYDWTGDTLELFLSDTEDDTGVYVLTKISDSSNGIAAVSQSGGTGNINFLPADDSVLQGRSYYYGLRNQTTEETLAKGMMTFADHPGR